MGKVLVQYNDPSDNLIAVTPHAADVTRSYILNDIGAASMTFAMTTPNLLYIIGWGNILRIHEYGVPTWTGIAVQRQWHDGGVTLSLKSIEWLLQKKLTGQGLVLGANGGLAAGTVAYSAFVSAYIHNCGLHNLQPGSFTATKHHFKRYDYADLYDVFKQLSDEDGSDFWVDANLRVHFTDARGTDKRTTVKLFENKHLVGVSVVEQADDILTAAVALGDGSDLITKPKLAIQWPNRNFFRAEVLNFSGVTNAEGLRQPAETTVKNRSQPKVVVDAEFVKVDSTWGQFFIGDIVQLVLTSVPSIANLSTVDAKVLGAELGGEDKMRLVFEIIPRDLIGFGVTAWAPT